MAQPTGTFSTYDSNSLREEFSDIIWNIDPDETPFLSNIKRIGIDQRLVEWQIDTLPASDANNAKIEGDDAAARAITPTSRLNNYAQIIEDTIIISGSEEASRHAGFDSTVAYEMVKSGKKLKLDTEKSLLANKAKAAGSDSVARVLAGVPTWIADNDSLGATGVSPTGDGSDTRTDGTQRAFTEALLLDVHQMTWDDGGNPDVASVGGYNKRVASGFKGVADDKNADVTSKRIIATASVYESDFGILNIVPNRNQRSRDVLLLEMRTWELGEFRPLQTHDLAKTGDSIKKQTLMEVTLIARAPKANGMVGDVTTAAA